MTQENRTLSVMLDKHRAALEKRFGPSITLEIENLFDFEGGPSLRHQLAHGLLSADKCHSYDSIYACWFIFRLCCLPLFRHWQQVADAYARMYVSVAQYCSAKCESVGYSGIGPSCRPSDGGYWLITSANKSGVPRLRRSIPIADIELSNKI